MNPRTNAMPEIIQNPYTPPEANLENSGASTEEVSEQPRKIFTPLQIRLGAFVGGPFAAVYFLYKNFIELENIDYSKKTIFLGLGFSFMILLLSPFLSERFPRYILPISYSFLAGYFAQTFQMSKQSISTSTKFDFQSNWKVAGISIVSCVIFISVLVAYVLSLAAFGVVTLA
jgi:hypothetical protein